MARLKKVIRETAGAALAPMVPVDRHDANRWRRSAVSKLQEAREAMARGQADPAVAAELDEIIARVTHRSRPESSYHASI
jgi:hypothetical protein